LKCSGEESGESKTRRCIGELATYTGFDNAVLVEGTDDAKILLICVEYDGRGGMLASVASRAHRRRPIFGGDAVMGNAC